MLVAALATIAPCVQAAEIGKEGDLLSVDIHAFASEGFVLTSSNNYLSDDTRHGSFRFSEVGINFTKSLTDKLRTGMQLFAQDLGPTGNYNAKVDWFYLDYRWQDWLGLRAGRIKIPFGLYNEVNDIDSARLPVLLPQSVYPIQNRNFLLAQTGAELYGYARSHAAGALDYRMYAGTIFIDISTMNGSPLTVLSLNVPYVTGARLLWETPLEGLRLGGSLQALRLDFTVSKGASSAGVELPAQLAVASVEYAAHDWLFAAEYSRWYTKLNSSNPTVYPSASLPTSERAYAMASYRATRWFQVGAYYSLLFPDVHNRDTPVLAQHETDARAHQQHDVAATMRFDFNDHWLLKLEGHCMVGTAALSSSLNNNVPLGQLRETWGVFLAKTTAYF
jgi:hypothetical protein